MLARGMGHVHVVSKSLPIVAQKIPFVPVRETTYVLDRDTNTSVPSMTFLTLPSRITVTRRYTSFNPPHTHSVTISIELM
jgi:hypothetical protein